MSDPDNKCYRASLRITSRPLAVAALDAVGSVVGVHLVDLEVHLKLGVVVGLAPIETELEAGVHLELDVVVVRVLVEPLLGEFEFID